MFEIRRRLKIIGYFGKALIMIAVLFFLGLIYGAYTLIQQQNWVDHTSYVLRQTDSAKQIYHTADYAGRNFIIAGVEPNDLKAMRQAAIDQLAVLRDAVKDNPKQLSNLKLLESAVIKRFETQTDQAITTIKTDDAITYKLNALVKSVQFNETVDELFLTIKLNEYDLLTERNAALRNYQWRLVYFFGFFLCIFLTVIIALYVLHRNTLMRVLNMGEKFDGFLQNVEMNSTVKADLQKFSQFIKYESERFPDSVSEIPNA